MTATSREAALMAARAADAKKATDIVVQEVGPLLGVTDYFVIVTAANNRQVDAIIDEVEEKLRTECGLKPEGRELASDGSWSLLDYGDLVVHVFQPQTREYYRLETLWNEAQMLDLSEEEGFENLEYGERIAKLLASHVCCADHRRSKSDRSPLGMHLAESGWACRRFPEHLRYQRWAASLISARHPTHSDVRRCRYHRAQPFRRIPGQDQVIGYDIFHSIMLLQGETALWHRVQEEDLPP